MLVRFLSILFLILAVALNGRAQDIHYSQFYMAPLHLNPAMAGVMNCNKVNRDAPFRHSRRSKRNPSRNSGPKNEERYYPIQII